MEIANIGSAMNKAPWVSVLIPCYNGSAFVGEAVDSALAQTYQKIEVVVLDDGSTDDSVAVLRKYGKRIKLVQQEHAGACEARNAALRSSCGEMIQWLDADDRIYPNKIERQLEHIDRTGCQLSFCRGNIFGDGRPLRPKKAPIASPEGIDSCVYFIRQGISTESSLTRRDPIEAVGGFFAGLPRAQERDLYIRLGATGIRISFLDEILYDHRHDNRLGRITRQSIAPDYNLHFFLRLSDVLESGPPYELDRAAACGVSRRVVSKFDLRLS